MADKRVAVDVPAERVPEFYAWFGAFLAAEPGSGPPRARARARARAGAGAGDTGEACPTALPPGRRAMSMKPLGSTESWLPRPRPSSTS